MKLTNPQEKVDHNVTYQEFTCESGLSNNVVSVCLYDNDSYYSVDFTREITWEEFKKIIETSFEDFIISDLNITDFKFYTPFKFNLYGDSLFGGFDDITEVIVENGEAFISVGLINAGELSHPDWKMFVTSFVESRLLDFFENHNLENWAIESVENEDWTLLLRKNVNIKNKILDELLIFLRDINVIQKDFRASLNSNIYWKSEYEKNESQFSKEVLLPLLRGLNFHNVHYNHGTTEYGKDFIFSEYSKFDTEIHYGMQVKVGDLSGNSKSDVREIINQTRDGFLMPFYRIEDESENYVSIMIIAISGKFTYQAKEKLRILLKKDYLGRIFFWDQEKIKELIRKVKNSR